MTISKIKIWIMASRPKTLFASVSPVIIGTALAYSDGITSWYAAFAVLFCAIMLQIGTNYSNDYFDYVKGTDTVERTGPVRATHAGLVTPVQMKRAFIIVFVISALAGIFLIYSGGIPILIIGIFSIICAIIYTGGPYPLGYHGLGDIFVIIFFGFIAVGGTYYIQVHDINHIVLIVSAAPGLFSTAILVVNNLRDIETDRKSGKRTVAVRFGKKFARSEYLLCILIPSLIPIVLYLIFGLHPYSMISSVVFILAIPSIKSVFTEEEGAALNKTLADTGKLLLIYSILFSIGWII